MPVTPTYPGLYIEELPFNTHTVQAAPTSIAAFIGYVNPWYTSSSAGAGFLPGPAGPPGGLGYTAAVPLYSFSDYEANFGGMFTSGMVDPSLPRAVFQFFANGGAQAYVVGLEPKLYDVNGGVIADFFSAAAAFTATVPAAAAGLGLLFTAKQFADQVPMGLIISNLRSGPTTAPGICDTFDVAITYGSTIETYRGVAIGAAALANAANTPDATIGARSNLASVGPAGASYGTALPTPAPGAAKSTAYAFTCAALQPAPNGPVLGAYSSSFLAADFIAQLQVATALDQLEIFNLLLVPGVADNGVQSAALAFAEHKLAFALLDPPQTATISGKESGLSIDSFADIMPRSQNGAIYFPWLQSTDTVTGKPIQVAPSGFVAGICAATDTARGVWKAPAGMATGILNTSGPVPGGVVTDAQHGELNTTQAVNCLRHFASIGTVVFGARTLVGNNDAYAQSKYVPVRRMTLFLEQTLLANLRWVVFEPNDLPLWTAIRLSIESFLLGIWNQGGLQGATPSAAFQVKCDSSTTTADDQQNGIVNIVVAFAPLKPAEFVIIKIAQLAGQAAG
jgi:phage tail sheath protein FI